VPPARSIAVIGGGPAGLAVARAYRDAGGEGELTLLCEEAEAPYERPPLTKGFLRGETAREELPLEPPEWFVEHGVTLELGSPASEIRPERREIVLEDGRRVAADVCVLATGSRPIRPAIDGAEDPDVLLMRSIGDSERLAARGASAASAIVIGSGFIGCEAAASLASRGLAVTMLSAEPAPQIERLGEAAAARLADWLREAGVTLRLGVEVEAIEQAQRVRLGDGGSCEAEVVLLAAGAAPEAALAARVGLELDKGAVPVDAAMRSGHPFILAVGDVASAENRAAGRRLRVEHWGDAIAQGEIAGRVLAGTGGAWDEVPGFWSEIGSRTLKYAAWGDGFDEARLVEHGGGAFTIWYSSDGVVVGVLTHERDEDYERGRELIARGDRS
jgi:3-phenylpropionate/trans-cinnamate dioxygenase ferredoxin reductase component